MKKFKFIYGVAAASMMFFASCSNDTPVFDDADAFVAFTKTTMSVDEFGQTLDVPVLLTSLGGLSGTVSFEADSTSTAIEDVHYTFAGEKTLSFSGLEGSTQYIKLNILDNDVFGGDVKLVLNLTTVSGANMGAVSQCVITIKDNEHPLKPILGAYSAYADTGRGEYTYEVTLEADEADIQKVWICDLEPYFAANGIVAANGYNKFYGIVNNDLTQIRVPAKQKMGYENVELVLLDPETGAIPEGDIYISIQEGGNKLVFETPWGVNDEGWWNYSFTTILTKK